MSYFNVSSGLAAQAIFSGEHQWRYFANGAQRFGAQRKQPM